MDARFAKLPRVRYIGLLMDLGRDSSETDGLPPVQADTPPHSQSDLIELFYDALIDDALWCDIAVFLAATFAPFPICIHITDVKGGRVTKLTPFGHGRLR